MRRLCLVLAFAAVAGCATTAPTAPTPREPPPIETRAMRGTDRFRVITQGLDPEVAVEGVREEDVPLARAVLEATLAALPAEGPAAGTTVDIGLGPASARVQLVSTAGNALLVVDVPPAGGASVRPKNALATAAVAQGLQAWEAGDSAAARQLALDSIRLVPGDPLEAGVEVDAPQAANRQNHLAWALLAQITDGAERDRWYVGALERSSRYLAAQLGATPEALLEPTRDELFAAARRIVEENLAAYAAAEPRGGGAVLEFASPIHTEPRQQVLLPAPFVELYAAEPVAGLLRSDAFLALAVDAFERLRTDPLELLLATREVRSLYLREPFIAPPPSGAHPADKMLSALVADVARKAAAGLEEREIAATLGEEADPRTLALARTKLAAQRERENAWYGEALGG